MYSSSYFFFISVFAVVFFVPFLFCFVVFVFPFTESQTSYGDQMRI